MKVLLFLNGLKEFRELVRPNFNRLLPAFKQATEDFNDLRKHLLQSNISIADLKE